MAAPTRVGTDTTRTALNTLNPGTFTATAGPGAEFMLFMVAWGHTAARTVASATLDGFPMFKFVEVQSVVGGSHAGVTIYTQQLSGAGPKTIASQMSAVTNSVYQRCIFLGNVDPANRIDDFTSNTSTLSRSTASVTLSGAVPTASFSIAALYPQNSSFTPGSGVTEEFDALVDSTAVGGGPLTAWGGSKINQAFGGATLAATATLAGALAMAGISVRGFSEVIAVDPQIGHTVAVPRIVQRIPLIPGGATLGHMATTPQMFTGTVPVLLPVGSLVGHMATAPGIQHLQFVKAANPILGHSAAPTYITIFVPGLSSPGRTLRVEPESRVYAIPATNRSVT